MSDRMEQGSWRNLAGGVLTLCLTLTGCGGGAEPPDNYGIGSDALPALTKLVALGSEMTCSVQENTQAGGDQDTDEAQGQPTYEYSGLESGNQVAAEYVQMLEDNYDCSILGSRDAPKEEPDFQAERGEVTVGTKCAEGDGIFALEIRWQTQSCSITLSMHRNSSRSNFTDVLRTHCGKRASAQRITFLLNFYPAFRQSFRPLMSALRLHPPRGQAGTIRSHPLIPGRYPGSGDPLFRKH